MRRPKAAAVTMVMALGLGGLAVAAADHLMNPPATFKYANSDEAPSRNSFAPVVKRVLPSVVTITSSRMVKTDFQGQDGQDGIPPIFRQFFGDQFGDGNGNGNGGGRQFRMQPQPRQQKEEGLGSGVIVSANGYILTNNHVVDHASTVTVIMPDRHEFKARVVGTDPKTDLAIVKVDGAGTMDPITIGDSDKVQVGDYVLAVGNPFGIGKTVTMGIVSATGRANLGIEDYEDFIQTDAAINHGNSGGALVNDRGELIGINTAILANGSEGNQGIGFAVPVTVARNVMDQIIKNGKVTRAYLGVMAQEVTPSIAKAFNEPEVRGALVGDVTANSPAQKAGLQKGDIILDLNGKPVNGSAELRMHVSLMAPGAQVNVKVFRNGAERTFPVTLAALPTETAKADQPDNGNSQDSLQGIQVENVSANTARQLGLPATASGVVVTAVDPNSKAAESGLKRGDVIQEVNHKAVRNTQDFESAMRTTKDATLLLVNRQGNTMYLAV
ncbi:MAG TPA: DegQ family serine endoprotease [Candidatus Sulfopaludibacter sp.]|nr:DegQ family serine endoprotease [Candidatus Sulfopaludibacter sp.]